jgi:hypothetical protein
MFVAIPSEHGWHPYCGNCEQHRYKNAQGQPPAVHNFGAAPYDVFFLVNPDPRLHKRLLIVSDVHYLEQLKPTADILLPHALLSS